MLINYNDTNGDKIFFFINSLLLTFALLIVSLPILNVIAQSFSSPKEVIAGRIFILPKSFTLDAYKQIFNSSMIKGGYLNSIKYTVIGTSINIVFTILAAYPLSRKNFVGRKLIMSLFVFTMIFTAPLIPTYLNVKNLNMLNSIWALVIPNAISVYNMVIARTFFMNIVPDEMMEAGELDGASDIQLLLKLVLPVSKSIMAVLILYYAVGHWNSYFDAFIYMSSENKFPLQVVLRNIMANANMVEQMINASADQTQKLANVEVMKYAVIVVGSIPVICIYPFVQKHFVKGVMIGSLKG
ncbi:MAG: carbohydrate ABC transporter permease [Lachnospirales bacterium]